VEGILLSVGKHWSRLAVAGAGGVLLLPSAVEAHQLTTGLGPVYDGISHLVLSPTDWIPVLTMALLAGLNGPIAGRLTLFALPSAWLLGGLAGLAAGRAPIPGALTVLAVLLLGVLIAVDRRLPPAPLTAFAGALGLVHGFLNGAGIAEGQREALALMGIAAAIFVIVALTSAFAVAFATGGRRIAFRVAGSWAAAIALLMLGWNLRGAA
jgi:urease accessory protein